MSTNYYAYGPFPGGEQDGEGLHIGLSTSGRRFLFQAHPDLGLTNFAAYRAFIRRTGVTIRAESGYELTPRQMEATMAERSDNRGRPLKEWIVRGYERTGYHIDPEGYEFCTLEFS